MESSQGQRGISWQSKPEHTEEAPSHTNIRIVIIVVRPAKANFQKPVAPILVATTTTESRNIVMRF